MGINNNYTTRSKAYGLSISGAKIYETEMLMLSKIFTPKQLTLIETAFEGAYYDWNVDLTDKEIDKCELYRYKITKGVECDKELTNKLFIDICENIIKNKGTFKL